MRRERWRGPDGFLKPGTKRPTPEELDFYPAYYCKDEFCNCNAVGEIFSGLVVISGCSDSFSDWIVGCKCGAVFRRRKSRIVRPGARTQTCGDPKHRAERCGKQFRSHGLSKHPLYGIWCHIKERCELETCRAYPNYGGRGIRVCNEWRNNPARFISWAFKNGYRKGLELDRRDNNGMYSPDNCRWVTREVNANNKRNIIKVKVRGEVVSLAKALRIVGSSLPYAAAYARYQSGRPTREVLGL